MLLIWVLVGTVAFLGPLGCRTGVEPPTDSRAASQPSTEYPPPWTSGQIEAAREDFASRLVQSEIPAEPGFDAVPPSIFDPSPGIAEHSVNAFHVIREKAPIKKGDVGTPVAVHDLWLQRRPTADVAASGALRLRWRTLRPMAGGRLFLGAYVNGPILRQPILRFAHRLKTAERTEHEVLFPLPRALRDKYDIQETRRTGRGRFIFRIQMLDPKTGDAVVDDGRFSFRCDPPPCEENAEFTQLPTVILGPFVDLVDGSSAMISFNTDVPTAAEVWVRDARGQVLKTSSSRRATAHELAIEGLRPGERYRYLVVIGDARGEISEEAGGTLRTPAPDGPLRLAVMSDSRGALGVATANYHGVNRRALTGLVTQAFMRHADLIVFAGDLIDGYTTVPGAYTRQLDAWKESVESVAMHLPIYEAMGNHELLAEAWSVGWMSDKRGPENSETLFAKAVVNPRNGPSPEAGAPPYEENVYSFDRGPVHLVVLNTNYAYRSRHWRQDHPIFPQGHYEGEVTGAQLGWLDQDLEAARTRGARHLVVFTHEPAFPNGGHVQDAMYYSGRFESVLERRKKFWRLLVKHGVLAAFFGDEHNYSRTRVDAGVDPDYTRTVWQITTGGAGAPFYAQDRNVPWANQVERFENGHHFVMLDFDGDQVILEARDTSGQLRDRVNLVE